MPSWEDRPIIRPNSLGDFPRRRSSSFSNIPLMTATVSSHHLRSYGSDIPCAAATCKRIPVRSTRLPVSIFRVSPHPTRGVISMATVASPQIIEQWWIQDVIGILVSFISLMKHGRYFSEKFSYICRWRSPIHPSQISAKTRKPCFHHGGRRTALWAMIQIRLPATRR